jgi:VanZ family protein
MPVERFPRRVDLALRPLWLAVGWLSVALIVFLSLTPDPLPPAEVGGFDIAHAGAYAWLGFWFAQLYPRRRSMLVVALALIALGIALEFGQRWTGYRTFSYADMRDDAVGVVIGLALVATPLARLLPALDARLSRGRVNG